MKQIISSMFLGIIAAFFSLADDVVIKSPGYFNDPIRDGFVSPDSLVFPRDAQEIHMPKIEAIGQFHNYGFTNLKKITFDDIDYIPGGLFMNDSTIEEIEFNGLVGHIDCTSVIRCSKLRKIVFHGPVSSTGGPNFMYDCPQLDSVIFESPVINFGLGKFAEELCPKFDNYVIEDVLLNVYDDTLTPKTELSQMKYSPDLIADLERIADWEEEVLTAKKSGIMRRVVYKDAKVLLPTLQHFNSSRSEKLENAMQYAWNLGDDVKSNLDLLKESPSYGPDTIMKPSFEYAQTSDSLLALSRERFNLDSVAGKGDDISRIKNLLYWVHDNIQHNGSNGLAPGARNLRNTYDCAKRDGRGYNCRALAICLTEALLAEGIPARYITCESKKWNADGDCHVICVAWSESLCKWIWVDPTFAAYITDENGLLLHPGEVRYRLQHDMPLVLNEDANWNNRSKQNKKEYLDDYMAKNLYIMSANMFNQAEPEGETSHQTGRFAALVPHGSNYNNAQIITTDEDWFWQSPENTF